MRERLQPGGEAGLGERGPHGRLVRLPDLVEDGEVQVVLAGEVLVDAAHAHAGLGGEVAHRGAGEAGPGEDPFGGLEQGAAIGIAMPIAALR